ncbi:MAG TPA: triosephosphate isomerase [Candidatus Aphodocola excrementigallinarum]|uniref:Triosephosphate isomerase n=1 Tax=Candidatus Aphodocola excrementigallinarum TaxID=2840670 RepID=A0A9D1IMJ6_9FIRM|nr:triosephosphate isomerase [Candidatus Aphodocola excrementigallinarum]
MNKLVVCNQKMFLTYDEASMLKKQMDEVDFFSVNLIVCPSILNLDIFKNYTIGSQDCFYEDKGAYTGEVSAYDLSFKNVKYVIIGHSDRRKYDSDKEINLKVKAALRNGITPILCIGETKIDKELIRTSEVLKKQLYKALEGILLDSNEKIIIAYEPVWAIGGEKTVSKEVIEDTFKYIEKLLKEKNIYNYKLIYGGSITSKNIKNILSDKIDGYLLGLSSVNIDELKKIIKCIK